MIPPELKTDADARLAKKGPGKEIRLSYRGHTVMENRNFRKRLFSLDRAIWLYSTHKRSLWYDESSPSDSEQWYWSSESKLRLDAKIRLP